VSKRYAYASRSCGWSTRAPVTATSRVFRSTCVPWKSNWCVRTVRPKDGRPKRLPSATSTLCASRHRAVCRASGFGPQACSVDVLPLNQESSNKLPYPHTWSACQCVRKTWRTSGKRSPARANWRLVPSPQSSTYSKPLMTRAWAGYEASVLGYGPALVPRKTRRSFVGNRLNYGPEGTTTGFGWVGSGAERGSIGAGIITP
jgi:hypothetical protein